MGKLMKKRSDGLWGWLCPLALAVVFLLGGLAGCLYAAQLSEPGEGAVASYLADYLRLLQTGELTLELGPILRSRVLLWLAVTVCGLTGLGLVGVSAVCGAQGFLLCYGCACFCRAVRGGAAAAAVLFGLPALLWAPVMLWLGCQSVGSAAALLRRCVLGGSGGEAVFSRSYWLRVLVGYGVMILCALVEYAVVPRLLAHLVGWLLW